LRRSASKGREGGKTGGEGKGGGGMGPTSKARGIKRRGGGKGKAEFCAVVIFP